MLAMHSARREAGLLQGHGERVGSPRGQGAGIHPPPGVGRRVVGVDRVEEGRAAVAAADHDEGVAVRHRRGPRDRMRK